MISKSVLLRRYEGKSSVSMYLMQLIYLTSAALTLASVVAAVGGLEGRRSAAGAAAKLHLRAGVGHAEHRAVPHVAAAESVEGSRPLGSCDRMLLLEPPYLRHATPPAVHADDLMETCWNNTGLMYIYGQCPLAE